MALKNFTAGESIKASETNSNNQFLLKEITDNAIELENYLHTEVEKLQSNFMLPGTVLIFPHDTIPLGYLLCDGSSLLREEYEDLFNVIGTIYGSVDDYHFNLPDYQGVFLRGYGGKSASIGTLQEGGVPNITGTIQSSYGIYGAGYECFTTAGGALHPRYPGEGVSGTQFSFNASRSSSLYQDGLTEVRVTNQAVNYVIKY